MSRSISALFALLFVCSAALARAEPLPPAPPPEPAAQQGPTVAQIEAPPPKKKKKHPMNSYAFGLQLGMGKVGTGKVSNPAYTPALIPVAAMFTEAQREAAGLEGLGCSPLERRCRTRSRFGFQLSLPIQIGGEGVGFRFEPVFTFADTAKAYGLYMGPTFNFYVYKSLYLGFGFGVKAAWVKADDWKYAGDLHGRIPFTATYYVIDDLALVLEASFGGGASAFVNERRVIRDPTTGRALANSAPDVTFGVGRSWDLSFGLRFP